jgi:ADP-heptose:LPS heptosyltransferase
MTTRYVLARPGALGDTLLTLPLVAWLRRHDAGCQIVALGSAEALALGVHAGWLDAAHSWSLPAWAALVADDELPATDALVRLLDAASVVLWLPDGSHAAEVSRRLGARQVVVGSLPSGEASTHATVQLGAAFAPLGIPVPRSTGELLTGDGLLGASSQQGPAAMPSGAMIETRTVAVHPGSGGRRKIWPAHQVAALCELLIQDNWRPLLIEGPADAAAVAAVLARLGQPVPVARDLSLAALAAVLARCAGYVGNDSGVTHLAALCGLPTVAIFGPTRPQVWRPLGPRVTVVEAAGGDLSTVGPHEVFEALRSGTR